MRETDAEKPAAAKARERRATHWTIIGFLISLSGVVVLVGPAILFGDIKIIPALVGMALVWTGGVSSDPETFGPIIGRALDKLPFGGK